MPSELKPHAVLTGLLLLAVYIYHLASRSREAELKRARGKCEIALQGAKRSLDGAARLHANEIGRLNATRGGTRESAATSADNVKLREAKSAFARLFLSDRAHGDVREREIRTEMFKQFWRELEWIENRD